MKLCGICGDPHSDDALETHHRIPRHLKGSDDPKNLIDICSNCHTNTHNVARLLKKNQQLAAAYLTENYSGKEKIQQLVIQLARVIISEEEEVTDREFVKVPLTLPVKIHRMLSDSSKRAKCSMHNYIVALIERDYNQKVTSRGEFKLKRL